MEVEESIVPPPLVLPAGIDEAISVDDYAWEDVRRMEDVRTYLQGTPSVARNLAKLARRSRAKAFGPGSSGEPLWTPREEEDLIKEPMDLGCKTSDRAVASRPSLPPGWRFSRGRGRDGQEVEIVREEEPRLVPGDQEPGLEADDAVDDDEAVLLRDGGRFHLGPSIHHKPRPLHGPSTPGRGQVSEAEGPLESAEDPHRRPWRGREANQASEARRVFEGSVPICPDFESGSDVTLHVYDLTSWTRASNLGIFHLGIQVYRLEYFFCSLGIQTCMPARNKGHIFKESIHLGRTTMGLREVRTVVQRLRMEWRMESYRILGRNCQSFATSFCEQLGLTADCVPAEYCRFSELESLRSQVTSLVDGAAAMLPRMPQRPSLLLACSMPTMGDMDLCSQGERAPSHIPVNSYASPRFPEEYSKSMDHPSATGTGLPHAARHARPESRGGA